MYELSMKAKIDFSRTYLKILEPKLGFAGRPKRRYVETKMIFPGWLNRSSFTMRFSTRHAVCSRAKLPRKQMYRDLNRSHDLTGIIRDARR